MKSLQLKNKRGVFGLTSVQAFFGIILGIALLAYVIVVIMGTLSGSTLLPVGSQAFTVINESGWINSTTYTLTGAASPGFVSPVITAMLNTTDGVSISSTNYTLSAAGVLANATARNWSGVRISYTYNANTNVVNNANSILTNTSVGITAFFGNVTPVYAILAILVIILVLIVLVKVVTGGSGIGGRTQVNPQL